VLPLSDPPVHIYSLLPSFRSTTKVCPIPNFTGQSYGSASIRLIGQHSTLIYHILIWRTDWNELNTIFCVPKDSTGTCNICFSVERKHISFFITYFLKGTDHNKYSDYENFKMLATLIDNIFVQFGGFSNKQLIL
jgi:hypothetical protein